MKIAVKSIPETGMDVLLNPKTGWLQTILREVLPVEKPENDFQGSLHIDKIEDTITLNGQLGIKLHPLCDRCGEETSLILKVPLRMTLIPEVGDQEEYGDMDIDFYDGRDVEIADIIREKIFLALPSPLLCTIDCKGRCPQCQKNLNLSPCSCVFETEAVSSPWKTLKQLKEKGNTNS